MPIATTPKPPVRPTTAAAPPGPQKAIAVRPVPGAIAGYVAPNIEALRAEKKQIKDDRAAARQRADRFKFVEGKNVFRVLPGRGVPSPFFVTWIHYIRNPATPESNGRPVICPLKTRKTSCIVCSKVQALNKEGNAVSRKVASDIRASRRIFANVVDIGDIAKGVQVTEFGVKLYEDLLSLLVGDDERPEEFPGVDYTHPQTGYNLIVEKEVGDKNNLKETTRYSHPIASQKPTAIPVADWMTKLHDLSKSVDAVTNEQVQAIMEGREEQVAPEGGGVEDDIYATPVTG